MVGISIREFARRAGCDEKVVRRKVKSGHIQLLADGTVDPRYLDIDWRSGAALPADSAADLADNADSETLTEAVDRIVTTKGRELWSKADAEKVKENYAALLKQLQYDRESARVAEIDDVVLAIASEYALVRNRLRCIAGAVAPKLVSSTLPEEIKALVDAEVVAALGSGLVDQSQKMTIAAIQIAEKKVWAHRS